MTWQLPCQILETDLETFHSMICKFRMPTPYGILLARIGTSNTAADIDEVHQLQDQITVTQIPHDCSTNIPAFDLSIFNKTGYVVSNEKSLPEAVLRLTAALAPYN